MPLRTMRTLISALFASLRASVMPRAALALENAALRRQLAVYQRTRKRIRLRTEDRLFWVGLRRLWPGWIGPLTVVKPATVVAWHRRGFKLLWHRKSHSAKIGRPRIPGKHISFIQRISGDHPEWGEDRIAEELATKFGITHSTSTIRRYMVPRRTAPRGDQSWRTLVRNHAKELWACDFLIQHTTLYSVAYIFIIMEIHSRRIVHVNVTINPTLSWVKTQIRQATPWGMTPRFLVHDNDGIFGQFGRTVTVESNGLKRSYRCHFDRWLDEVMGIKGMPIPYGAPNASPHVERFIRTLRQEALDHFIFFGLGHIRRVVKEYIRYYNAARPTQAIGAIPDPYPELKKPPPPAGKLVALPVLGGIQHDCREDDRFHSLRVSRSRDRAEREPPQEDSKAILPLLY